MRKQMLRSLGSKIFSGVLMSLATGALIVSSVNSKPVVHQIASIGSEPGQVIWIGRQALVSQKTTNQILIWDQQNLNSFAQVPNCQPSTVSQVRSARTQLFLVGCTQQARIAVVNVAGQVIETFPRPEDERSLVPNASGMEHDLSNITAMVQDSRGGTYVSIAGSANISSASRGKGRIYYLSASRSSLTPVANKLDHPNGLVLSADGKSLYVSEALSRQVKKFSVQPGQLSNPVVHAKVADLYQASVNAAEEPWPGALLLNEAGHLFIALSGEGRILVLGTDGKRMSTLELPVSQIKGMSFARTNRSLLVTGSDSDESGAVGKLFEVTL